MSHPIHPLARNLGISQSWTSVHESQSSLYLLHHDLFVRKMLFGFFFKYGYLISDPIFWHKPIFSPSSSIMPGRVRGQRTKIKFFFKKLPENLLQLEPGRRRPTSHQTKKSQRASSKRKIKKQTLIYTSLLDWKDFYLTMKIKKHFSLGRAPAALSVLDGHGASMLGAGLLRTRPPVPSRTTRRGRTGGRA